MQNRIILMNDLPGIGKAALNMMFPILTKLGMEPVCLPTAILSNTLNFGEAAMLDTSEYLRQATERWEELGETFDSVLTGFVLHEKQAQWMADFCRKQREKGTVIFCDPILGDRGKLYRGVTQSRVDSMKDILRESNYLLPNYTEGCVLTGREYFPNPTEEEVWNVVRDLRKLGAQSVILKSVCFEGRYGIFCYDAEKKEQFICPHDAIPVNFFGTGDVFASLFAGKILRGEDMATSIRYAADTVQSMIVRNVDLGNQFFMADSCLDLI